jgi:hypothetical protein
MLKAPLVSCTLWLACSAAAAQTCESIQSQIELKIRAAGTADFRLVTVPADSAAAGQLVGTCDRGAKKILYTRSGPAAGASAVAAPPAAKPNRTKAAGAEPMLTECKDGSMSVGGDCKK